MLPDSGISRLTLGWTYLQHWDCIRDAFKKRDNTIVAIMYNSGAAKSSIVKIGGKLLQFSMPADRFATVVAQ
jgi:hypothetical protein